MKTYELIGLLTNFNVNSDVYIAYVRPDTGTPVLAEVASVGNNNGPQLNTPEMLAQAKAARNARPKLAVVSAPPSDPPSLKPIVALSEAAPKAEPPPEASKAKVVTIDVVGTRGKAKGSRGSGRADVVKNVSIRLYGTRYPNQLVVEYRCPYDVTFKVGDQAVYGSYNLVYTGKVIAISEKQVTIAEDRGLGQEPKLHRLELLDFERRNWNFDADKVAKHNHETMLSI